MRSLFFVFIAFALSLSANDFAAPKRSFTLSSGYLETVFNSNEALVDFSLSAIEGYGALFDVATNSINNTWWSRLIIALVELPVSYWVGHAIFIPYHEFGHARAFSAFGQDYTYGTSGYGKTLGGIPNFWLLTLCRLITPPFFFPGSGYAFTSRQGTASQLNSSLDAHWGRNGTYIVGTASGLNNQMLMSKRIADRIYQGHGHITHLFHYLGGKLAGWGYSFMDRRAAFAAGEGDVRHLINDFNEKGYGISNSHFELQSLLSLVSGTSYAILKGYYDYVAHGDANVYPAELFGVRLPDINSYINARGLSFEVLSGYRVSEKLFFDLAYEFIWKGESAHQVTPSAHFDLAAVAPSVTSLWVNANVVIGKGVGGGISSEWAPFGEGYQNFWQRFSYFADLTLYNGFNLYGERNITSLRDGRTLSFSGFGGLRLNY